MRYWVIVGEGGDFDILNNIKSEYQNNGGVERTVVKDQDITFVTGTAEPKVFVKGRQMLPPDVFLLWGHYSELFEGISNRLVSMGARSINDIEGKRKVCSKLSTLLLLEDAGIPQPKSMVVSRAVSADCVIGELGLPVVFKPSDGSQGAGVELLCTKEEVEKYIENISDNAKSVIIAQEYIAESKGRDVRVTMADYKPFASFIRQAGSPDEFRSNIHQGGYIKDFEIDDDTARLCERVAEICGLRFCGIDLLFTRNGFVVGEVNCTPGLPDDILKTEEFAKTMKRLVMG